jgi:hypothetical protein
MVVNVGAIRYVVWTLKSLRTILATFVAIALLTPAIALGAQSDVLDLTRIHWTSGDHLILGFPTELRAEYVHVSPVSMRNWDNEQLESRAADDLGTLKLNLAPRIVATDNTWSVFQFYIAELEMEAREYLYEDEGSDVVLAEIDPERRYRKAWGDVRLVQALAQAAGEYLVLKVGLTRSNWGAGLLAHSNRTVDSGVFASPFGTSRYVDQYFRAQLVTLPLGTERRGTEPYRPVTVAVAADATVNDANSNWAAGDRTYTGIGAVMVDFQHFKGGVYVAHRVQDHATGGSTSVTAIDLLGDAKLSFGATHVRLMSEVALIVGETDYAQSVFVDGPLDVFSHGGLVRLGVEHGMLEVALETGWASGDDNPYDSTVRSFSFNPGYRVGVLMFSEVLRTGAAVSAMNISDPDLREDVPRALDKVTHRGVIRDAVYVNPRLAVNPLSDLSFMVGFLMGQSLGDFTDPFWTSVNGGVASGPHGAMKRRELGYEIDVAVHYRFRVNQARLGLRGEFAFFAPGAVFDSPQGESAANVFGVGLQLEAEL